MILIVKNEFRSESVPVDIGTYYTYRLTSTFVVINLLNNDDPLPLFDPDPATLSLRSKYS